MRTALIALMLTAALVLAAEPAGVTMPKIPCPDCAADGAVPEIPGQLPGGREERKLDVPNQRWTVTLVRPKCQTDFCPTCNGCGFLLKLPNGQTMAAATETEMKLVQARWSYARLWAKKIEVKQHLKKIEEDIDKADADIRALAKAKAAEAGKAQ